MAHYDRDKQILYNIVLDKDFVAKIDDYKFEMRFNSRAEAVRDLLKYALEKKREESG